MVTTEQLDRTKRLALELTGIELFDRHRELLERRSRRSGIHGSRELDRLLAAAEAGDPRARERLVRLVTTGFTGFFRHPRQFEIAAGHLRRTAQLWGQARAWSAAAATGEEPWSLAMALGELSGADDLRVSLVATDVNDQALSQARRGEYSDAAVSALAADRRERWLEPVSDRRWRVIDRLHRWLEFRPLNLVELPWPVAEPFDVIFCRNVLMYLEAGRRHSVLERMVELLAPDGLLILDPTEHPGAAGQLFAAGAQGIHFRAAHVRN